MSASDTDFDVVVLGGGPAGATAALVLARAEVRTLLIEGASVGRVTVGESLPPGAKPLLRRLQLVAPLDADGHLASCGNESAWGTPHLHSTQFVADPNGHGWHLHRQRFDTLLRTTAGAAGAHVSPCGQALRADRAAGWWTITTASADGRSCVRARWVVDCTGRRAWTSRVSGATRTRVDRLVAFVAKCPSRGADVDVDSVTLVESAPCGWWYTSRLPSGERIVAYLTDAHDDSARRARTPRGFGELLAATKHVCARAGGSDWTIGASVGIVAADTSRLDRVSGDHWLAAGDAAMSFDPLSSQGILTAMYSGMTAAHALQARLGGDSVAMGAYDDRMNTIYATYLQQRRAYYAQEQRWGAQRFWRDRSVVS